MKFFGAAWGGVPPAGALVGLVAGTGHFPVYVAEAVRRAGYRLWTAAIERSDATLRPLSETYGDYHVGHGGRVLELAKNAGIRHVLLAGAIQKKQLFDKTAEPDELTRATLSKIRIKGDDALLRTVTAILSANRIRVLDPAYFLKDLLMPKGVLTPLPLQPYQESDIAAGKAFAKAIGRLDIGQTVVVKDGVVIAVEAIEGTDAVIRRVKELGIVQATLVKVSKPQQDLRFDMPVIGVQTIQNARDAQITTVAVESGKSLLLERKAAVRVASEARMTLVGV